MPMNIDVYSMMQTGRTQTPVKATFAETLENAMAENTDLTSWEEAVAVYGAEALENGGNIPADLIDKIVKEVLEHLQEEEEPLAAVEYSNVDSSAAASLSGVRGAVITQEINDAIMRSCAKYGVDVNLVKGVIQVESWFRPNVTSTSGAMGLMQLMPGTATWLGVTDGYDINQNIDCGVNYLRQMLDTFNHDVELALAGYNAGPNAVKRFGGIPPYAETIAYVPRVLQYQGEYLEQLKELG